MCNAAPSADTAPPLLALGAKVKLVGLQGERVIALEDFFTGPGETVLGPAELLTEIQIQELPPHSAGVYLKHMVRKAMELAIVGVAVVVTLNERKEICKEIKIALGTAAPTPIRARKAEETLKGKNLDEARLQEAAEVAASVTRPSSSIRASAEYRREMVKVLTRRAVKQAWQKAQEN